MTLSWQNTRILVAGCGSIGRRHARVLRSMGVGDIRVCDPAREQRDSLIAETRVSRQFDSYEAGLASGPDAVFICTPPGLHIPMSIAALETGAHVFCEKPLAEEMDGVERLAEAVRAARREFMVGFCFRYHEGLRKAKGYLDAGRIGRLVSIRCRMGEHLPTVRPDYRTLFTTRYSGAFDLTHEIDLACWFAGHLPISEVKSLHASLSDVEMRAPDVVEILVRFGDACLASIHLDFFSKPRCRLTELLGTEGAIAIEFSTWDECTIAVYEAARGKWERETLRTERDDMFLSEDKEFLSAVAGGSPVSLGLEEAGRSLQIVCAARNGSAQ